MKKRLLGLAVLAAFVIFVAKVGEGTETSETEY